MEIRTWQPEMNECFALIFLLERRLEATFDRILAAENLTAKQWLVLAAVEGILQGKPSIQEVARQLSTSHQNIKAIALNLEKRGFLLLEKDPKDKRVTRLSVTAQSQSLWQARVDVDKANLEELFQHLSGEEVLNLKESMYKLMRGADEMAVRIDLVKVGEK
ncbi:MarR family transcriptional regulator [Desulfosporosinus sp.]|uniref:MarR family winged helix-turn-helix transcriptional regulator n=1 Tax=Desulfosporosinus sp. TaxID=157907 RepID=UPI0025C5E52B|nr:MarR family transcriptional regulator [Desulfosporosinus sp.]MBC2724717.1 winged helix DNA-binding protein [Desulfosporosinus sp.]MBC2727559.1 winged helix DNA-binding protein [Desulfosporosinus sp.]